MDAATSNASAANAQTIVFALTSAVLRFLGCILLTAPYSGIIEIVHLFSYLQFLHITIMQKHF